MKKYSCVESIYSIESISNGCLKVQIFGKRKFVYLFKVEPVIAIGGCNYSKEEIITKYEEFLRMLSFDFQIITETKKIEAQKYFFLSFMEKEDSKAVMREKYLQNVEKLLKNSKVYVTDYYFIIYSEKEVENVEKYFKIFEQSELDVKKVVSKSEIEKIIMKGVGIDK